MFLRSDGPLTNWNRARDWIALGGIAGCAFMKGTT